jgi:AcrR family transcriptional regulator
MGEIVRIVDHEFKLNFRSIKATLPVVSATRVGRMSPDARRAQLLDAGMALFRHGPYEDISIDDIARSADVSKGLLYHYFPTKRDFIVAAVTSSVEELTALLAFDPELDPYEQADVNIDAYLTFAQEHSGGFTTVFRTRGAGDPELERIIADAKRQRREFILEGLARLVGQPLDELRTPVLETAVEGWIFFTEGVVLRWLEQGDIQRDQVHGLMRAALERVLDIAAAADNTTEMEVRR